MSNTKHIWWFFFDENPTAVIQDAVDNLTKSFEGLQIKKSRVAEFMKDDCNLSIKVVIRHPKARNSPKFLEARTKWVEEGLQKGLHFMQNCAFFDEAGFDINMRRSRDWSWRGIPAIIESPSARGVSHIIIGVISAFGLMNVSMREPGTTASHYAQFFRDTLDIMDEFPNVKRFHIVMDNAPIYSPEAVDPIILERRYIPVYLPPYSPELNPI